MPVGAATEGCLRVGTQTQNVCLSLPLSARYFPPSPISQATSFRGPDVACNAATHSIVSMYSEVLKVKAINSFTLRLINEILNCIVTEHHLRIISSISHCFIFIVHDVC